jgi:hypothetical protein
LRAVQKVKGKFKNAASVPTPFFVEITGGASEKIRFTTWALWFLWHQEKRVPRVDVMYLTVIHEHRVHDKRKGSTCNKRDKGTFPNMKSTCSTASKS